MKINYLQNPNIIPLAYLPNKKGERTFVVTEDIEITLSDGRVKVIPKGYETDLASIPNWGWSVFRPIDKGFIGDLTHDFLWSDKIEEIKHFEGNVFEARKFADEERLRWRKAIAPEKKIKNKITHKVIRSLGGFYYSKQLQIPD